MTSTEEPKSMPDERDRIARQLINDQLQDILPLPIGIDGRLMKEIKGRLTGRNDNQYAALYLQAYRHGYIDGRSVEPTAPDEQAAPPVKQGDAHKKS